MTQSQQNSSRATRIVHKLSYGIACIVHGGAWGFGLLLLGFAAVRSLTAVSAATGALAIAGATYRLFDADEDDRVDRLLMSLGITAPIYLLGVTLPNSMPDRVVYAILGVALVSIIAFVARSVRTDGEMVPEESGATGEAADGQEEVTI